MAIRKICKQLRLCSMIGPAKAGNDERVFHFGFCDKAAAQLLYAKWNQS